jgi:radical SAM superfamily enzyme YgiQ (UPF0313 family)
VRVLLVSVNREEINMPAWPLGLACVAASTEASGHEVVALDLRGVDDPRSGLSGVLARTRPEIIGLSVRNVDDQNMERPAFFLDEVKEIVQICRSLSSAPIVLGGAGYSLFPQSCLDYVGADMGIQGEGESVFPVLVGRIAEKAGLSGIPGLFLTGTGLQAKRSYVANLDRMPLPSPGLVFPSDRQSRDFWLPVQSRRGCPLNCSYCSTSTIEGNRYRQRSPEIVARWLAQWMESGVRRFFFVDNTFNRPTSYARELCDAIARLRMGIEWRCIIYPDTVDTDLADRMARAGCTDVALGFESGSEQILHALNKRFKPGDVRRVSETLAEHGIRQMGFLLLGGPDETMKTVEESLAFADSLKLDALRITCGVRIYPYTALACIAAAEGVVSADDDLLQPRFYVAKGLEKLLKETVKQWAQTRPNWIV